MESTQPPQRPGEPVLAELMPFLMLLYPLIEGGNQLARQFTDEKCEGKYNPWLYPGIVRDYICRGLDALDAGQVRFGRREIPNSGIEVAVGARTVKVWKATPDGQLPPSGERQSRIDFWNGNLFAEDVILYNSLAVIWEVDGTGALAVQLVAPRAEGSPREAGQQLWAEKVPHPATMMAPPQVVQHELDDLDEYQRAEEEVDNTAEEGEGDDE